MDYEELNYEGYLKYSNGILELLTESYSLNFNITRTTAAEISKSKIESLKDYLLENKAIVIVAMFNEELAGLIWLHTHEYFGEKRMHINQVVVGEKYRNRGIADRLMLEAEEKSIKHGITKIDLFVSENNSPAMKLYTKKGYKTERRYLSKDLKEMN